MTGKEKKNTSEQYNQLHLQEELLSHTVLANSYVIISILRRKQINTVKSRENTALLSLVILIT